MNTLILSITVKILFIQQSEQKGKRKGVKSSGKVNWTED